MVHYDIRHCLAVSLPAIALSADRRPDALNSAPPPANTLAVAAAPQNLLHLSLAMVLNEPVPVPTRSGDGKESLPASILTAEIVPNRLLVFRTRGPG